MGKKGGIQVVVVMKPPDCILNAEGAVGVRAMGENIAVLDSHETKQPIKMSVQFFNGIDFPLKVVEHTSHMLVSWHSSIGYQMSPKDVWHLHS